MRLAFTAAVAAFAALLANDTAVAAPKKPLGDYSQVCQEEHLRCLNDCQKNYTKDANIRACFGVCDDWMDDCDVVFPKARMLPGALQRSHGVLQEMTPQGGATAPRGQVQGGFGTKLEPGP